MLSVWLPLNGDLRNQGLANITATNNGATVDNNGKIGKCYSFDGNDDFINLGDIGSYFDGSAFSICFWIYSLENKTRAAVFSSYGLSSTSNFFGLELNSSNNNYCNNNLRFDWLGSDTYSPDDFVTYDAWTHICVTYDGVNQIKMYKNGTLIQTSTRVLNAIPVGNTYYLGRDSRTGSTAFNGKLNDFRIYDHCLSPRECKQVSAALVLHYPLSMPGQENLLVPQISDNKWTNWRYSTWDSTNTREKIVGDDGKTWAHIIQNTTAGYGGYTCDPFYNQIVIDSSKRYTWSCIAKAGAKENAEIVLWYHWRSTEGGANLSQSAKKFQLTSNPQRISWTLPQYTNNTYTVNRINLMMGTSGTGNNEIYFTDVKFEEGSRPTPWLPNPADTEYSALGFNDGIEYDVSGYGHNGTKHGDITYVSDTPRYNVSTSFNTNESYLVVSGLTTIGFSDSFSIAWWGKVTTFDSKMMWGFGDGILLNGLYYGNLWNTGDGSNNPIYQPETTTKIAVPSVNVWHHYVMTGDGTQNCLYVDGVLYGKSKTYKAISGTTISFNGWGYSSNYRYTNEGDLKLSDFRIYSTALSAEDVYNLYAVGASISDTGVLFSNEVSEV